MGTAHYHEEVRVNVETLLQRLRNDRYSISEHSDDLFVRGWEACADHFITIVERWACEEADAALPVAKFPSAGSEDERRVLAALRELRDAPTQPLILDAAAFDLDPPLDACTACGVPWSQHPGAEEGDACAPALPAPPAVTRAPAFDIDFGGEDDRG